MRGSPRLYNGQNNWRTYFITIINGHYDGKRVVLNELVPADFAPQNPVKVTFEDGRRETVLDRIAKLAGLDDLPADYSEQHDHYVKGTPRM